MNPLEEEAGMGVSRHKGAAWDITPPSENVVQELVQRRSDHGSRHKKNGSMLVSEPQNALNGNLPKEEPWDYCWFLYWLFLCYKSSTPFANLLFKLHVVDTFLIIFNKKCPDLHSSFCVAKDFLSWKLDSLHTINA